MNRPDLNFNYPAKDFLADVKGVEKAIAEKPFGEAPEFDIDMGGGEIRTYKFNAQSSMFQKSSYFQNKYGDKEGTKRCMKFDAVWRFVFGNINLLIQNKLAVMQNGKPVFRDDFDDFLCFLLTRRISPKDGTIERKAIKHFFAYKNRN
jgi:hypothetical protein